VPEGSYGQITAFNDEIGRFFNGQAYVERPWLAAKAAEVADGQEPRQLVIVGEPGSGKSAFIAHLAIARNCPRYFIRLDSVRGTSGLSARSFLVWLGTQLYQKYGRDIFPGPIGDTKVSSGIAEDRAQVVGRFIEHLYTLPFIEEQRHDVEVKSLYASGEARVIGEQIREVHDSTLSLDEPTLLEIAVLAPLRRLHALRPDERVLMLIDALDEAAHPGGRSIISVIPNPSDAAFPPNLRLVMTSRPGDHLVGFPDRLYLQEFVGHSQQDVRAYIERRLAEPALAEAARKLTADEYAELVARVADNSGENFLYLRHFFDEVRENVRNSKPLNAIRIPRGIDEVYRFFAVERIKGDTPRQDWKEVYLPVLAILAVLREPVRVELLVLLADVERADVEYVIGRIKPFLAEVETGGRDRYGFFHGSFRDYLLDPKRNTDWTLDGPRLHACVADHFRPAGVPWSRVNWSEQHEDYPYRHLAGHLLLAGRTEELHELVATGEDAIPWALAHYERSKSYGDYLQDLELAWDAAGNSPPQLARVILYALIATSIRSIAWNLSADLLRALGKTGVWTWAEVLGNLEQASDTNRGAILKQLLPVLPVDCLDRVAQLVRSLRRDDARADVVRQIAAAWPRPLPDDRAGELVSLARGIRDEVSRARALAGVLPALRGDLRSSAARDALKAAAAVPDRLGSLPVWPDVLKQMPEAAGDALQIADGMEDEWARMHVLGAVAACDGTRWADELLARLRTVKRPWVRIEGMAQVLSSIPPAKRGLLPVYWLVRSYCRRYPDDRGRAVAKLMPLFGRRTRMALAVSIVWIARRIEYPELHAGLLLAILEHLPQRRRAACAREAVGCAEGLADPDQRFGLLLALVGATRAWDDGGIGRAAIRAIDRYRGVADRHRATVELAKVVPDALLPEMLDRIKTINKPYQVGRTLAAVAARLRDGLVESAKSYVLGIGDDNDRASALAALAVNRSPELRRWVFSTAAAISTPYHRAQAFVALARLLPEMLPELREASLKLEEDDARASALVPLLGLLPAADRAALVAPALAAARKIPFAGTRGQRLAQLVPYVPAAERAALAAEALSCGQEIGGGRQGRARPLVDFYARLPTETRSEVTADLLDAVKRVSISSEYAWTLGAVVASVTPDLATEAQREILARIMDETPGRWYLLGDLAGRTGDDLVPDLVREADRLNGTPGRAYDRARILSRLIDRLPADARACAVDEVVAASSAQILVDLPDEVLGANGCLLWRRVLQSIEDSKDEATWSKLAARVPAASIGEAKAAMKDLPASLRARLLCTLAQRADPASRRAFVQEALAPLIPIIDQSVAHRDLIKLAAAMPADTISLAVELAERIGDEYPRGMALSGVACGADASARPETARRAFNAIAEISNVGWRSAALQELAPVLPDDLLGPAFDLVDAMPDDVKALGYSALGARAPSYPRFRNVRAKLREEAALAIRNRRAGAEIAVNLAWSETGKLQEDYIRRAMLAISQDELSFNRAKHYARLTEAWKVAAAWQDRELGRRILAEALRALRFDTRWTLQENMMSLADPLAHFGGAAAVRGVLSGLESVMRWWP
jgi:hypothetical protein